MSSSSFHHVLLMVNLSDSSSQITHVSGFNQKSNYPPLRKGVEEEKIVPRTVHLYKPETLKQLRPRQHIIEDVSNAFISLLPKDVSPKPRSALSERESSFILTSFNKLAEVNLPQILKEIIVQTRTVDDAKKVLEVLYKKSVNERKFSSLYVEFYKKFQQELLLKNEEIGRQVPYILLDLVKGTFDNVPNDGDDNKDEEQKTILKFEFLGNCQFISELFKQKLVKPDLPIYCMDKLVHGGLISLEALAFLLKDIGQLQVDGDNLNKMNSTFDKIKELVKGKTISFRHRVLLEDGLKLMGVKL
ncbi:MIF4G domain-containing protein [Entamoeba marina]